MDSKLISELEKEQIEEWLYLKQECEECLSSTEAMRQQKQLVPIQEAEEEEINSEEATSEPANSEPPNSDNENDTDNESQRPDLDDKIDSLMEEFRDKTDALILEKHADYLAKHPKAVMQSQERENEPQPPPAENGEDRKTSIGSELFAFAVHLSLVTFWFLTFQAAGEASSQAPA